MKQTYLYNRIEPLKKISFERFQELIKTLNSTFEFNRIEFEADTFEAQFDYDYQRLQKMLTEHERIDWVKMMQENEDEIFVGIHNNFFYIQAHKDDFFNFLLSEIEFKWAFRHENLDNNMQNEEKVRMWNYYKVSLPKNIELFSDWRNEGEFLINSEDLPGHEHIQRGWGDNLWFGSCFQMYFSNIYYKYIPKELFDAFTDCEENIVLANGLRKITLFKNPDDYNLPLNRDRQWAFRRKLGIDSIAHEVCNPPKKGPVDLPVEITKYDCKNGQTRVTRYLDKNNKLVIPSKAVKKHIKEFLDDGITIVFEQFENV